MGKVEASDTVTPTHCFVAAHRHHVAPRRRIPGEVYGVLADFPLVNLVWAMCLVAYTGPASSRAKGDIIDSMSSGESPVLRNDLLQRKETSERCLVAILL